MIEIYGRDPLDPKYRSDLMESHTALEAFLTKLRMILFTRRGDVYGFPLLGLNLEDMLFTFGLNEDQLQSEIREQISLFCPEAAQFDLRIEVKFFEGLTRDEALIDFWIDEQKLLGIYAT